MRQMSWKGYRDGGFISEYQNLGNGCEGGVKSIRGFWLDNTVVEACVDWIPGTWKITYQMTLIILNVVDNDDTIDAVDDDDSITSQSARQLLRGCRCLG